MRMFNKDIWVTLNTPQTHSYFPGDTVNGNVHLNLSPDIDLTSGISVTLYGFATVSWIGGTRNDRTLYTDTETFFEIDQVHRASHNQSLYPFSITIPSTKPLPWSAVTESGSVEYGVRARIKRPMFQFDKRGQVTFTLQSPISSRMTPESTLYFSSVRKQATDEIKVRSCRFPLCCWYYYCAPGKLRISITHRSPRVFPGKDLPFAVEVDNTSTPERVGNGKIQLVGSWMHIANGNTKSSETVFHEQILNIDLPPGQKSRIKGALNIPLELMPTQVECKVLKLTYKLRVICSDVGGFRCLEDDPFVDADVVIGVKDETAS